MCPMSRRHGVTGSGSATSEEMYPRGFAFKIHSTSVSTVKSRVSITVCSLSMTLRTVFTDFISLSRLTKVRSTWWVELESYPLFGQLLFQVGGHRFEWPLVFSGLFQRSLSYCLKGTRKACLNMKLNIFETSRRHWHPVSPGGPGGCSSWSFHCNVHFLC